MDWDSPDAQGPEKFEGRAPAYYTEKRSADMTAEGRNLVLRRSLIVSPNNPGVRFEEDDVVTFLYRNSEWTGKVQMVEERDIPGQSVLGSIRLTLQEE